MPEQMDDETQRALQEDFAEVEKGVSRMNTDTAANRIPQVKEVADGRLVGKTKQVGITPMHLLTLMTDLSEDSNWLDLGCNVVAAACASTTPLYRIFSKEKAEYKKKSRQKQIDTLTDLLEFPNLNQTDYDLFFYTYYSLYLYGNAYWQVIKNRAGEIHSIYSLPPESMRVIPYMDSKNILHFAYYQELAVGDRYFFEDEIIHFKMPNPKSFCYGKPVFYSQLVQLASSINAQKAVASWFEEAFVGGKIFRQDSDEEVANRNREYLKDMFTKPQNFGRPMLLEGGMELISDGNKFKDFDLNVLSKVNRDDVLVAAGIPLSVAGVRSDSGQANTEVINAEEESFIRNTVNKVQKIVMNTLNNKMFLQILGWRDVRIEPGVLTKFNNKNSIEAIRAASEFGVSINEVRDMLGLQRVASEEAGKLYLLKTNNGSLEASKVLGIDFNTGDKVETIFDLAQKEVSDKAKELKGGSSGLGGEAKEIAEGD